MSRYSVVGRPAADTNATAGHVAANLWNPSSAKSLSVVEIRANVPVSSTIAPSDIALRRSTTQGSPGSSVTPDIDNDYARALAPPSACSLGLAAFSGGQPTLDTSQIETTNMGRFVGSGFAWVYEHGIIVPPGTGLACACLIAVILEEIDWTFVWDEMG